MEDITPSLLKKLQEEFSKKVNESDKLIRLKNLVDSGKATHKETNQFAIMIGEILSNVFRENLSSRVLPDGKMDFNIADRIINATFKNNHRLVTEFADKVQASLNAEANIGVAIIKPEVNQNKIDGIVQRLADEEVYDVIAWILQEPTINFTQSVVDEFIDENARFHNNLGLKAKVIRISTGDCCKWCESLAGEYEYPNVPQDVYRRHQRCKCTVEYKPGDGRSQDIWSKSWI